MHEMPCISIGERTVCRYQTQARFSGSRSTSCAVFEFRQLGTGKEQSPTSDSSSRGLDTALDAMERNESPRLIWGRRFRPRRNLFDFIDGC